MQILNIKMWQLARSDSRAQSLQSCEMKVVSRFQNAGQRHDLLHNDPTPEWQLNTHNDFALIENTRRKT